MEEGGDEWAEGEGDGVVEVVEDGFDEFGGVQDAGYCGVGNWVVVVVVVPREGGWLGGHGCGLGIFAVLFMTSSMRFELLHVLRLFALNSSGGEL